MTTASYISSKRDAKLLNQSM